MSKPKFYGHVLPQVWGGKFDWTVGLSTTKQGAWSKALQHTKWFSATCADVEAAERFGFRIVEVRIEVNDPGHIICSKCQVHVPREEGLMAYDPHDVEGRDPGDGPYCSTECAGVETAEPLEKPNPEVMRVCAKCSKTVPNMQAVWWQDGKTKWGPYCSEECSEDAHPKTPKPPKPTLRCPGCSSLNVGVARDMVSTRSCRNCQRRWTPNEDPK